MNYRMRSSLRQFRSRSVANPRTDTQFKSMISEELRSIINNSVQEYLQKNKIPVASIDIKVGKDCQHCKTDKSQLESTKNIRLDISTSTMEREASPYKSSGPTTETVKPKNNENTHWMTWTDSTPFFTKNNDLKNYRLQTAQTPLYAEHRCPSPFIRPTTRGNQNQEIKESSSPRYRPCSRDSMKKYEYLRSEKPSVKLEKKMSVAVGPDKHFETAATNTQQSYQISDYLKKSMNLNDPYERKVFSSLMEVLRKRNQKANSIDTESIAADPVIQLSEYKSKFRNPQNKSFTFPTKNTSNTIICKRPQSCLDKVRPLGQLRPKPFTMPRFEHGEQFLY